MLDPRRSSIAGGGSIGGSSGASVSSDGSGSTQQTAGTFMTTATSNIPLTKIPKRSSTSVAVKGAYFLDNPVIQSVCKKIAFVRVPNKTRPNCYICKQGFGLRRQRHHCQSCGEIYW
jgi:hypothetical protein